MSDLTLGTWTMPAAGLGGENPLPPLQAPANASTGGDIHYAAADAVRPRGDENVILPYRLQDQYDRTRRPRAFRTAVLENEHLRATFLLEVGGRLWSLVDKSSGRELLYVNPVFQPANLALRDAWISGGVEWNYGIIGHGPFTVSPVFAARLRLADGTPVLRLYEWDRVRCAAWQLDAWLPPSSRFLLVRARLVNPHERWIPTYWWSNIAVPEADDVRVICPAASAFRHLYDGRLTTVSLPIVDGLDVSYPSRHEYARDLYFDIPAARRKWVTALDASGAGLVHASTDRLCGRKVFNWGTSAGGRRWQQFLSLPGRPYIEIQGGLAQMQRIYRAMPAGAQWEWLEAYGLLEAEPRIVHGRDWSAAADEVGRVLDQRLPQAWLDEQLAATAAMARQPPEEVLHRASGWGALEDLRRRAAGEALGHDRALVFDESTLGEAQGPWLALLREGRLPEHDPSSPPPSLMVQAEWRALLERSMQRPDGDHWAAWYHLGVMRFRDGDVAGARAAWDTSLVRRPSAWAWRNLAVLAQQAREPSRAADLWLRALELAPTLLPLVIECGWALLRDGRASAASELVASLPDELRRQWRVRLLAVRAALDCGRLDEVEAFFRQPLEVTNMREGEASLTDLWFELHERRLAGAKGVTDAIRRRVRHEFPPPAQYDFRLQLDKYAAPPEHKAAVRHRGAKAPARVP